MQTVCHLAMIPHAQAEKYGSRIALEYKDFGGSEWKKASWIEFSQNVRKVSLALLAYGIKPQENIGVFSQNAVQYIYTDFGAFGIRAVSIPFYATSSEQQLQFIIDDAQIRIIFVGEQEQYDKARRVQALCHTLERIVIYDKAVCVAEHDITSVFFDDFINNVEVTEELEAQLAKMHESLNSTDIANILYTSGTTGESKGVILTCGQYAAAFKDNNKCVPVTDKDRVITFLPITHIFERGWDFLAMTMGSTIIVNTDPHEIQQSMRETHPTSMSAVPRFWEKVYTGVMDRIDHASKLHRKIFLDALETGRKYHIDYRANGKRPPLSLIMKYRMYDATILSIVRKQFGLEKPNIFPTAGAVVSRQVEEFVHSLGLTMIVGYGLTESLATVSCDHKNKPFTVGSVGRPISTIDIKIAENGEILLKGPTIARGYYRREELNKEAFTEDGYFRTGDAGYLRDGELFLTERIKDLYKTSNGKYIAPQAVESKLLVDKFIEQIAVIADERKFVSALIVPSYPLLEEFAREFSIPFKGREDLCSNPLVMRMLFNRINTLQQGLAGYEQVKRFTLLTEPFSIEKGEVTNTLKTRRSVIAAHYKDIIDRMYEDDANFIS